MNESTRTTEGVPAKCPICGKSMSINPSAPMGDAVCPHCGILVRIEASGNCDIADDIHKLADLGCLVETDDEGSVRTIRLAGRAYDDRCINKLAKLTDVDLIDIRDTMITAEGADRLRRLLPNAIIQAE